jgi:hypothetical protein
VYFLSIRASGAVHFSGTSPLNEHFY